MDSSNLSVAAAGVAPDSQGWIGRLRTTGAERDAALVELHALLLRAARFEVNRRRATSPHLRGSDYDDLAQQSADDALVAILRKLGEFRGDSRFTTWRTSSRSTRPPPRCESGPGRDARSRLRRRRGR
jgi:RNA polymerase sigma-70 factor (ECF subfamily)